MVMTYCMGGHIFSEYFPVCGCGIPKKTKLSIPWTTEHATAYLVMNIVQDWSKDFSSHVNHVDLFPTSIFFKNQISCVIILMRIMMPIKMVLMITYQRRSLSSLSSCSDGDEEAFRANGTVYPPGGPSPIYSTPTPPSLPKYPVLPFQVNVFNLWVQQCLMPCIATQMKPQWTPCRSDGRQDSDVFRSSIQVFSFFKSNDHELKKSRGAGVPSKPGEKKDDKYWERRRWEDWCADAGFWVVFWWSADLDRVCRKNNLAAKKSRDARRVRFTPPHICHFWL